MVVWSGHMVESITLKATETGAWQGGPVGEGGVLKRRYEAFQDPPLWPLLPFAFIFLESVLFIKTRKHEVMLQLKSYKEKHTWCDTEGRTRKLDKVFHIDSPHAPLHSVADQIHTTTCNFTVMCLTKCLRNLYSQVEQWAMLWQAQVALKFTH